MVYRYSDTGPNASALARTLGITERTMFKLRKAGHGPKLTPIEGERVCHITYENAIAWIEDRLTLPRLTAEQRDRHRDAIRQLRVERANAYVLSRRRLLPRGQIKVHIGTREDRYRERRQHRDAERTGTGMAMASFSAGRP